MPSLCAVCNTSHAADATCPAYAARRTKEGTSTSTPPTASGERPSAPVPPPAAVGAPALQGTASTADAESLIIEMEAAVSPAALGPGSMLGAFRLIEEIGAGGMGRVFRARDTALEREVAVKLISPDFLLGNTQAVQRFLGEAKLTAKLDHPNVVHVFNLGSDASGNPFLVMALLRGRTLSEALKEKEAFPVFRIVSIGVQVLSALAAAHEHLVHRDLKPGNIFLTPNEDGEDTVTVLDFGVAKALRDAGADLTRGQGQHLVVGTRPYIAPEVILGATNDDPRQDLYSFGVVLFQMVARRGPWTAAELDELPTLLAQGRRPRKVREVAPHVDVHLAEVIDRALAVDPAERWQSAQECRAALRSLGVFSPGAVIGETYRIERKLGEGGMSAVYLAHDLRMERPCALKALLITDKEDGTGVIRERFRRDGALAKDVRHSNVVEVYAQGVWLGRPYIVTEYVDGVTLREFLKSVTWPSFVLIVGQVAAALDAVHEAGIVHRDVTPENILVDARGAAKLVDFGHARRSKSELTHTAVSHMAVGRLGYAAPEQAWNAREASASSDEWSLAAIVYEALTGQMPYEDIGDERSGLLERYSQRLFNLPAPAEPSAMNPSVSAQLSAVLVRALASDAAVRFPSATAFADALAQAPATGVCLASEQPRSPEATREVSSSSTAMAWSPEAQAPRRSRTVRWQLLVGAAMLIVVGGGAGSVLWVRSARQPVDRDVHSPRTPVGEAAISSFVPATETPDRVVAPAPAPLQGPGSDDVVLAYAGRVDATQADAGVGSASDVKLAPVDGPPDAPTAAPTRVRTRPPRAQPAEKPSLDRYKIRLPGDDP